MDIHRPTICLSVITPLPAAPTEAPLGIQATATVTHSKTTKIRDQSTEVGGGSPHRLGTLANTAGRARQFEDHVAHLSPVVVVRDILADYAGEPLSVHAAKGLVAHIHSGDLVYIITGFVLLPWKQPETDGMASSMMLARFLIKAFDCTPVLVVPVDTLTVL